MSIALDVVGVKRVMWAMTALICALFVGGCAAGGPEESVGTAVGALCSGVTLAASPPGPQPVGAQVTITASGATCGAGETPEYSYYYQTPQGNFVLFRNFSTNPVAVWDTTGLPSGAYQVAAVIRPVGGTQQTYAYLPQNYSIGAGCTTTTSFTQSPTSPQPSGTHVTLSATATCTAGATPEFRYAYFPPGGSSWVFINPTFTSVPYSWDTTGLSGGAYTLIVLTRAVGNGAQDSTKYGNYTLGSASTVCTNVGATTNPNPPQAAGTQVTITGSSSGCGAPRYIFYYRLYGSAQWLLIRDFGTASVSWNTTGLASGTYEVAVGARDNSNAGGADAYRIFNYAIGSQCGSVTLSTSPNSPQTLGLPVTLTGAATCTNGATPEYRFTYQRATDSAPVEIRSWGAASVSWNTLGLTATGYTIKVFARAVGNTSDYDSAVATSYNLIGPAASSVVTGFGYFSCSVLNNGQVECWGANDKGQLGNGSTSASSTPVLVSGLTGVTSVSTGYAHACAVLSDHTVRCWGDGVQGQLGNGGTSASSTPVTVSGLSDATGISSGMNHNCALRTGGAVSCWGLNANGQVGDATATNFPIASAPVAVATVSGASAVSAGGFHSCALVSGAVTCWGDNSSGQLGDGATENRSFTAVAVTGLAGVTGLSSGEEHTCALVAGGAQCWGDNTYGQLGNGSKTQANTPVTVTGLTGAVQVSAGFVASCARLSSGAVSCWGYNSEGELGNGSSTESLTPTAVSGISTASALSTGSVQSCVSLSGGGSKCWGYNGFGQLGNGTNTDAHTPVSVNYP